MTFTRQNPLSYESMPTVVIYVNSGGFYESMEWSTLGSVVTTMLVYLTSTTTWK